MRPLTHLGLFGLLVVQLVSVPSVADEPGLYAPAADEPALSQERWDSQPETFWSLRKRGPRMLFSYRTFSIGEQGGRSARYHMFGVDRYFISSIVRAGGGFEIGFEDTPRSNFIIGSNFTLGAQYPSRLNPCLDFVLGLGVFREDILYQDLYGFVYQLGLDAGVDLYVARSFFIALTVGWRRPVFRRPGDEQVEPTYVYYDSFTTRLGFGF